MSVEYDIQQSAFKLRMRYDNTIPGVINIIFVSHMGEDQDPLLLPTFSSDEFPCLALGTGLFQNQRDNSGAKFHPHTHNVSLNSNSHEFELHRPSNKGTKLLLKVTKAIIIINQVFQTTPN